MIVRNPPDFPPPFPRHALLQHTATKIRIHQTLLGIADRFEQSLVGKSRLARKSCKRLILEDAHQHFLNSKAFGIYNTQCYNTSFFA